MHNGSMACGLIIVCSFLSLAITRKYLLKGHQHRKSEPTGHITQKLENTPLDENVNKQGEAALKRLSEAHDIHVPLCPVLLGEFNDAKYKYSHEITRQYMLASGAFIIENPEKASDTNVMNLAAVESAIKVYSAILQLKPGAKWKTLDAMLK